MRFNERGIQMSELLNPKMVYSKEIELQIKRDKSRKTMSEKEYINFISEALFDAYYNEGFRLRNIYDSLHRLGIKSVFKDARYVNKKPPQKRTIQEIIKKYYWESIEYNSDYLQIQPDILEQLLLFHHIRNKFRMLVDNNISSIQCPVTLLEYQKQRLNRVLDMLSDLIIDNTKLDDKELVKESFTFFAKETTLPELNILFNHSFTEESDAAKLIYAFYATRSNLTGEDVDVPGIIVGIKCLKLLFKSWSNLDSFLSSFGIMDFQKPDLAPEADLSKIRFNLNNPIDAKLDELVKKIRK